MAKTEEVKAPKPMKFKLPKTLAACADRLYEVKEERKAAQRIADQFKLEEAALTDHLINNLPKGEASSVGGKVARATIVTKQEPTVNNWDLLYAHIKKTGSFELLGRSLSAAAIKERWEAKKAVPGVGVFTVVKVSLNKL